MGRNRAIKTFDPRATGRSLDLFTATDARLPVIMELLRSPWVMRASELIQPDSGLAGKHRERAVEVVWDSGRGAPRSFMLDGRRHAVDAVVQTWAVERAWWDPRRRLSRRCYRVLTRGGLYDLAFDRITECWLLVGIVD
ncbi:MAG: hypothetical protein U1E29_04630 [Coriobacteriia bacterium]|nr:hypothetical protein [Coriobacteriia bacterium]